MMFDELEKINTRPNPFEFYTASDLWTDEYTSKQMLTYHLQEDVDISSRNIEFINRSVQWIVSNFQVKEGTQVADFGCGPGLYSNRFARFGAEVTGIDFSKNSIQYAREVAVKENLSVDYVNENYLEFETDRKFDLVIMIMCDFCALSPAQRKQLLEKFHKVLKSDGAVLLDVHSLNAFESKEEVITYEPYLLNGFWSPNKYYGFLNTFKYDKEKVILDKYTIIEKSRTRTIYNWLQYFDIETLKSELEESGFIIEELYLDVAGNHFNEKSNEFAVIAKKY